MRFACVLIALAAAGWAQKTASVSGEVSPVGVDSRVKISVRLQGQGELRNVMAGRDSEDGKFFIDDLAPGEYTLSAQREGYIRTSFGVFRLKPGEDLKGIRIEMVREGVLAGKVLDPDDNPIGPAQVMLWRKVWVGGRSQLQNFRPALAGKDGVFHVRGLGAGKYYLSAAPVQGNELSASYFPNAVDPAAAAPLVVGPGSEIGGITLHLRRERAFRLRGRVVDETGALVKNVALGLLDPSWTGSMSIARAGTFEITRLRPGTYVLATQTILLNGQPIKPDVPLVGRTVITISDSDMDDFVFELHAPARVEGSIRAEKQRPKVRLVAEEFGPHSTPVVESSEEGAFAIDGVAPDRYRVEVTGLAAGSYVKSVRFANQDARDGVIDMTAGNGGNLEIAVEPNGVEIAGAAGADLMVSLWGGALDRPKMTVAGKDGAFHFGNLPPGDYKVAAWESLDQDLATVAEFLNLFSSRAADVSGSASAPKLTPIPRASTDPEAEKFR